MSNTKPLTVTLNLTKLLRPEELKSFEKRAKIEGRTVKEHVTFLLFGTNPKKQSN
ncbi:hypothetical protein [Rubellicoccus peritrichatus]|uniref:Uncharacterized protein n=1 Tax=Rubellicoccus peritrichatus TaxID=3080537 RepID=A0AAQ3L7I2_9BACT|nr:hypothetical protein [Puniceicoccus sp. CR14]WOO40408.1 hypothetical protein RZN69_17450 [Puniceicoccus sp. CR14]WOO40457.1 hypothetical protein RZN69_17695 [Puniceicoccus sp. CR14]WOO40506.1 hypothetical protein RZN69_17940 [Puniceicoccus sp. CR14]WOO40556.1 hypothetical protein RZN69_18190 [Puniceicoccus sp. CR14]